MLLARFDMVREALFQGHHFLLLSFAFYLQVLFVMLFRAVGMASVACGCRW